MKRGVATVLSLILFLAALPRQAFTQTQQTVIINEFATDPHDSVELWNTTEASIDISGWIIDDDGGSNKVFMVPEGTVITPLSCVIFPETEGSANNELSLNKSSDTVQLLDTSNVLVDDVRYSSYHGDGNSWQRIPNAVDTDNASDWSKNASASAGLHNDTRESCIAVNAIPSPTATPSATLSPTPTQTPTLTPTPSPTQTPIPTPTPIINNIYLSEVLINPDNDNEWVELYNDNDYEITLTDWYIDDLENAGATPKKFTTVIAAKNYATITFTSAIFNNNGDSVRLLNADKQEVDATEYGNAPKGQSLSRQTPVADNLWCFTGTTPNAANNSCPTPTSPPQQTGTTTTTTRPTQTPPINKSSTIFSSMPLFNPIPKVPPLIDVNLAKNSDNDQNASQILGALTQNNSVPISTATLWVMKVFYSAAIGFSITVAYSRWRHFRSAT